MEIEEIKKLLLQILKSDNITKEENVKLLIFNGSDKYSINKFLLEAIEISEKCPIKILIDDFASEITSFEHLEKIPNVIKVYRGCAFIDMKDLFKNVDTVILGTLTLGFASKVANLNIVNELDRAVSYALINNIDTIAIKPIENENVINKEYLKQINKIEEKLISFNINFLKLDDIKGHLFKCEVISEKTLNESKIITEDIIKNFHGKELKIANNTVVTPLANDIAKEKKILITRGN